MPVLALIADLIGSKKSPQRSALQKRLARTLEAVSADNPALASPYTLTLGDEFQAVYQQADSIFADMLSIMTELHPMRARFAIGLGRLSTAVNPHQALGMDGPAFHHARSAMETMKRSGSVLRLEGDSLEEWRPMNHVLAYLGHHMGSWSSNRFAILRYRLLDLPAVQMATDLGISRVAVHKNIRTAALDEVAAICHDITAALARGLKQA